MLFRGAFDIPTGILRVSDALGEQAVRITVADGSHLIGIYADAASEATEVDVVLDPKR